MITVSRVGNLVRGDIMDVSVKPFLRALRDLDKNLYVRWNPAKLRGHGCWEIRRLPSMKTSVYQGTHEGADFYRLGYVEYNSVHHVLDCAFLNYDVIRKLKSIDSWDVKNFADSLERREEEMREIEREKAKEALKYAIKQNKSAARDFYEMVKSGVNPAQILTSINWGS